MNPNIAGIVAIVMWSISPLLILGAGDTPPFQMGAITLILPSVFLFIRSRYLGYSFKEIVRQPIVAYLLTTYGIGGYIIFWFLGFKNAPAFEANTLNYLWPILLVAFSFFVSKEKLSPLKIIGLLLGFIGTALLFSQKSNVNLSGDFFWGYVFALIAAFVWATYSTATRYVPFPNRSMMIFLFIPGLLCLLLHLAVEERYFPSYAELFFLFLLGITRVSFVFWDYAMKHGEITFISSLSYFIPIISTGLLLLFGFVPRNEMILLSAVFVISGCLIVNFNIIRKSLTR